jgi:Kef-type K+ transport system membrane component KefB
VLSAPDGSTTKATGDIMSVDQTKWRDSYSLLIALGFVVAFYFIYNNTGHSLTNWYWLMLLFVAVLAVLGKVICGTWKGVLVDERNVLSLSRVQMVAWSILVLTASLAMVLQNVSQDSASCLIKADVSCIPDIPGDLWLLMGFSTATLVTSPVLLSNSAAAEPDEKKSQQISAALAQQGYQQSEQDLSGPLYRNPSPAEARWSDLITGEQNSNCLHLDLPRVQMCFFTLVALLIYGVMLHEQLLQGDIAKGLPDLNQGLLAIIAISHGGYLVSKASQNSATTNQASPQGADNQLTK